MLHRRVKKNIILYAEAKDDGDDYWKAEEYYSGPA